MKRIGLFLLVLRFDGLMKNQGSVLPAMAQTFAAVADCVRWNDAKLARMPGSRICTAQAPAPPAIGRGMQHGEHRQGDRRQNEIPWLELDHVTLLSLSCQDDE